MRALDTPKKRALLALGLVLAVGLVGPLAATGRTGAVRWALGAAAASGLCAWCWRRRQPRSGFELAPQLEVLARAALSGRCGLALVEAEGRRYLVVHGDGFARLQESRPRLPAPRSAPARGPAAGSQLARKAGLQ